MFLLNSDNEFAILESLLFSSPYLGLEANFFEGSSETKMVEVEVLRFETGLWTEGAGATCRPSGVRCAE